MKIKHISYSNSGSGAFTAAFRIHEAISSININSGFYAVKNQINDPETNIPQGKFFLLSILFRPLIASFIKKALIKGDNIHRSLSILPSGWPKRINESSFDIVHLHWVNFEMLSIKDISRIKKPIVWTLHDMWAFCGSQHLDVSSGYVDAYKSNNCNFLERVTNIDRWIWKKKAKAWKKKSIQIVTPSTWLAKCVKESALMMDWAVTVVPNPINTDLWAPVNKEVSRQILGLPTNGKILAFGAFGFNTDKNKGYDLFIEALQYLENSSSIANLSVVLFGGHISKEVNIMGFKVYSIGPLQDIFSMKLLYSAADALVMPSRIESFGQTATEANACCTPVIGFNNSGLNDIIIHKQNGWLAEAFDTNDLAEGINWVLENEERLADLSRNARADTISRFSYPVVARLYEEVYKVKLEK